MYQIPENLNQTNPRFRKKLLLLLLSYLSWGCVSQSNAERSVERQALAASQVDTQTIALTGSAPDQRTGGLIAADVNGDAQKDLLITKPGQITVYTNARQPLWSKQVDIQLTGKAEDEGLPGLHAPGVQAADVDGDGTTEVLFLTEDNTIAIVQGSTGETEHRITLEPPQGAERWEHLVVANFRGNGDRDVLLQATNAEDYRLGRYLAAYAVEDLLQNPQPLWTRDDFHGPAHNGARVADLDGDGKHEVLGGTLIGSDGRLLFKTPMKRNAKRPHIDSIYAADVRPDLPGLEVVALEEGGDNRIFLYNSDRLIWKTHFRHQEPQNAAIGDFDPNRPGLEIWCRSRYDEHQKPFVFDAQGKLIADYKMDNVAPPGWTTAGVEVIFTVDWTGKPQQLAAAKERHKSGDIAVFDPLSGEFLHRFSAQAERLYVADVAGDWREELIVIDGNELQIYSNQEPNPHPNRSRLWTQDHYRHSKMTWNYYSP